MKTNSSLLSRSAIFAYGVFSYAVFFTTFLYLIGFLGNIIVPKSIDAPPTVPLWQALLTNLGLIALFGVQHSGMARPAFKRWWTRSVPAVAERSTYVLFSSLALIALFGFWQPMGGTIWHVTHPAGAIALQTASVLGWSLVLFATFLINHFDLFGLRQVWLQLRAREHTPLKFNTPALYRVVRHPLYAGFLIAFWATPTMTVAHLVFALGMTAYILAGIRFEERDLIADHPEYADYRQRVPMLIPHRRASVPPLNAQPPRGASKNVIAEVR